MREICSSGTVGDASGNRCVYPEVCKFQFDLRYSN